MVEQFSSRESSVEEEGKKKKKNKVRNESIEL